MSANTEIVRNAFTSWMNGTGSITSIFADDMQWEIVGHSAASRSYANTRDFIDAVLAPFARRFSTADPFRPRTIRGIYTDDAQNIVIVVWDGRGTTISGTVYANTYAWIMRLANGKVAQGTAFYDSISFNELWETVAEG